MTELDDYPLIDNGEPSGPKCLECGEQRSSLVGGKAIYPHRPDLYSKDFWLCACGAYCGCHPNTTTPLGFPCGPETRRARNRFHSAFDPVWRGKKGGRHKAYDRLAKAMGLTREECHGAMFSREQCDRAVEIIKGWRG